MQQLGKTIYVETGYDWANVGTVVTKSGAVLIDCPVRPTDSAHWQKFVAGLHPRGARYLIATDFHGDHIAGTSFIDGIGDSVNFLAPQVAFDEITKGGNAFSKKIFVDTLIDRGETDEAKILTDAVVPTPTFCWEETMVLHLEPVTFNIKRMGGHSPGTSAVVIPEEGVIFASDVVCNTDGGGGLRDAFLREWIRELEWIQTLPVDTIVPGHGEVCGMDVVRRIHARMLDILGSVTDLVKKGLSKDEAISDPTIESKFFAADTSKGAYWMKQRQTTFRTGIARVYDEVKESV